ncbi:pilus (MSHA type) biogenesis protein MshL [Pseudoxanthomonas broegbernensis]|uniref:Pilus (MSHA type) biogenesis protein MshL n=1 Tax=Pseudoxanthomonas broegbernensis TaxID=83619 RepID=A0A7V8GNS6_9GAMM|nr:pilus (MSHA type) biogenesis protein MshL [Pseudoxanthomonas broegbernensis]KAF1687278.1 pilus (MSHA type) biogenesis protein MshL [Pseudoxanthomonas broegbernensis]MBB6065727.1 general secretion pathway protein D [Pseudoxanthomonas broegbernensis]
MSPNPSTPRYRTAPRLLAIAIATMVLASCSTPRSVRSMPKTEHKALERVGATLAEESARLAERHDKVREDIERQAPAPEPPVPMAPVYDPLENSVVSLSMYDADVGQLLWALAGELKMNLIVDPRVLEQRQRASLHLRNVTAREVYNHILEAFDLHGEVRGGALMVSQMSERIFNVDMLDSSIALDLSTGGDVFGAGMQSAGGGGQSLRGNLTMTGAIGKDNDPYKQLDAALKTILGTDQPAAAAARGPDAPPPPENARFNLDPGSGTLYVRARPSQMRAVEDLIDHSKKKLRRQVLVEAQILDVSLSDNSNYGVDWNLLRNRVAGLYGTDPGIVTPMPAIPGDPDLGIPADPNLLPYQRYGRFDAQRRQIVFPNQTLGSNVGRAAGLSYVSDTFSAAVNVLRSFGNVKVLSNPSVRVRNGSPAYLSVGTNIRYVTKSTTNVSSGGGGFNTSSDIQTDSLFSGVVIGVAPMIHENGSVELLVHPMQTEVEPASLALREFPNGNAVTLPVINVKGITTTLNLRDGDTVMLGGLIDQQGGMDDRGIPGLSDIPGLGRLFGAREKTHKTRELVVVLRVKVI